MNDRRNPRRLMGSRPGLTLGFVVVLLAVYWLQAVTAAAGQSATFDEMLHLQAGMGYLEHGDYRSSPLQSTLPCKWAALPAWLSGSYTYPATSDPAWQQNLYNALGSKFFYEMGNDLPGLLFGARAMAALWGVLLGVLVFAWARHLFGNAAGWTALTLFAFSPTFLAHGALVTAGVPAAFFLLASSSALWLLLQRVSPLRVGLSCVALAGLLLTKMSGLLILPIAVALVALRLLHGGPLELGLWRTVTVTGRGRQVLVFAGVALAHVVVVTTLIWASFGFRYSAFATPGRFLEPWPTVIERLGAVRPAVEFARRHELLPEGWLYGMATIVGTAKGRRAFLAGEYSTRGWLTFFPIALLVKTPGALFLLLVLAALALLSRRQNLRRLDALRFGSPLWVLFGVYWVAALASTMNIGHRHLLPTYPVMFIVAGAATLLVARWQRVLVSVGVIGFLVSSLAVRPHYLAYFNLPAGGPAQGYRWLVDSSLDWGQDLPGLQRWLAANAASTERVYLSYFGTARPEHYGIRPLWLPGFVDRTEKRPPWQGLQPGTYCISATMLQGVYSQYMGPWSADKERMYRQAREATRGYIGAAKASRDAVSRARGPKRVFDAARQYQQLSFLRLCAYLRQSEPAAHVGHSILIYRVTAADLRRALDGPM